MPDREKVFRGLSACAEGGAACCKTDCPYYDDHEYLCFTLIARDALELLKGQEPTVSGWVSVKDRMPKQNGDYLAYTRDGIVWPYFFMAGVWEDALGNSTDTVTHWMPLPEPPEVKNG